MEVMCDRKRKRKLMVTQPAMFAKKKPEPRAASEADCPTSRVSSKDRAMRVAQPSGAKNATNSCGRVKIGAIGQNRNNAAGVRR